MRSLLLCGLILGALTFSAQHGLAGYDNPSSEEFAQASREARANVYDLQKIYACWHSKLGPEHRYTHQGILRAAKASIMKAYLEGHTGWGESAAEALRLCRATY